MNMGFIYDNLDKLFTINFTMLAFIITAVTILQTIHTGRIAEFRASRLFDEVIEHYNSSISWNFISGCVICVAWFVRVDIIGFYLKIFTCIISFLFFGIAIFKTYTAYKFLIYFIKKQ